MKRLMQKYNASGLNAIFIILRWLNTVFKCLCPIHHYFVELFMLGCPFLQDSRSTTEGFILTFWLRCVLTITINTLHSITKKNSKDRAGLEHKKWSLYQQHVWFSNPCARAESHQQEHARKLCSATLRTKNIHYI